MEPPFKRRRRRGQPAHATDDNRHLREPVPRKHTAPTSSHFEGTGLSNSGPMQTRDIYNVNFTPRCDDKVVAGPELRDGLFFEHMDARLLDLREAQRATCEWILHKEAYATCMTGSSGGLLWIKGKPGAGKSVLMKFLDTKVKEACNSVPGALAISFFFNARGIELARTTVGLYRSLLWQLFVKVDGLEQQIRNDLEASTIRNIQESGWTVGTLKHVMSRAMRRLGSRTVQVLIDALDECDVEEVKDMLDFLDHMADGASDRNLNLQVCFSSRHYPHLTMPSESGLTGRELILEDQPEHGEDIKKYIQKQLQVGKSKRAKELKSDVLKKSGRIFLWVFLVIRMLNDACANGRIEKYQDCLKEIPPGLDDLFKKILSKDGADLDFLRKSIQWTLFAGKPLKLDEYFYALRPASPRLSDITRDDMRRFVDSSSKGLAEVTRTRTKMPNVQFIHESVRDFFLLKTGYQGLWPALEGNFVIESQAMLSKRCLNEIHDSRTHHLAEIQPNAAGGAQAAEADTYHTRSRFKGSKADPAPVYRLHPFLQYSVQHLLDHTEASIANDPRLDLFYDDFGRSREHWFDLINSLETYQSQHHTQHESLVYFCMEKGLFGLLQCELSRGSSIVARGGRHKYPLYAALASGKIQVLEMLLSRAQQAEHEVEPNSEQQLSRMRSLRNYKSLLPLASAVDTGKLDAVDLLLEAGFRDERDERHPRHEITPRSGITVAVSRDDDTMVEYLLRLREIRPQLELWLEEGAVLRAVNGYHWNIARMMLNSRDLEQDFVRIAVRELTQFHWSSASLDQYRRKEVDGRAFLGWLLAAVLDSGSLQGPLKSEALILAAIVGDTKTVERMLCNLSDIPPESWHLALNGAAKFNCLDTFSLLLPIAESDISLAGEYIVSSWLAAVTGGHAEVVKLLLERHGLHVNLRGYRGQSPLLVASDCGHVEVTKLLLDKPEIDVNLQDNSGESPLLAASYCGHVEVTKLLLEEPDINVNLQDNRGKSPLLAALLGGNTEVIKLLLDKPEIDVNLQDKSGKSPLLAASHGGHTEVIKLLLDKPEIDVNLQDNWGISPLTVMVWNKRKEAVKLLLGSRKVSVETVARTAKNSSDSNALDLLKAYFQIVLHD